MELVKTLICLLSAIMFFAPLRTANAGSGWLVFHERSFKGEVIDTETKEPIEGAVVVAQYHVNMLGPTGSHSTLIDVQEALTDKKGEFFLPSMTKVINPISTGDDTSFLIWKPGYKKQDIWGGYFFAKEPGTVENRRVQRNPGPASFGIADALIVVVHVEPDPLLLHEGFQLGPTQVAERNPHLHRPRLAVRRRLGFDLRRAVPLRIPSGLVI